MIRNIRIEDAPQVAEIVRSALSHETETEVIEKRIKELSSDPHYFLAVAERDGLVLGFIEAGEYTLLYGDKGWNIIALAVAEKERRTGLGRSLVMALEEHAKRLGATFVRLNSRLERADAHAFYSHLGYAGDKVQKRFIKML